ncbi:MAG: gephyrin-like molybdotransferase Glp [Bacteroidota bacterium]
MISFEEAQALTLQDVRMTGTERVGFTEALYRVLAEDVHADIDMPPFNKAAMDGYACRKADLGTELKVIEVIAAGDLPQNTIQAGQCAKIMTGGMVPQGADTVIMVEQTKETSDGHIRFTGSKTAPNIAYKGEDVQTGDLLLTKGTLVLPQHAAILAAAGCTNPLVAKKPLVAILSTGDELVEPDTYPGEGKIRNSNGFQLTDQVKTAGCIPHYMGIIPDDEEATDKAIAGALSNNDVVILTGGVSAGDYDFVPKILRKNKVDIQFQQVAVKPGKPTVFGRTDHSAVFGLPGNPVSSFINFETFVKPLLYAMMGHDYQPLSLKMPLGVPFSRKKADRLELLPVSMNDEGEVVPVRYHGSAHIHAICLSKGLMYISKGVYELEKGAFVDVRPL